MAYQLKTTKTSVSAQDYLSQLTDPRKQEAIELDQTFSKLTGVSGWVWGSSIIGYGSYQYTNAKGHPYEFLVTGFSPRKTSMTVYLMTGFEKKTHHLEKLGKHKLGKSCLYLPSLAKIDRSILKLMIQEDIHTMNQRYVTQW